MGVGYRDLLYLPTELLVFGTCVLATLRGCSQSRGVLTALCFLTILREILWLRPLFIYVLGMAVASAKKESDYDFSPWGSVSCY